MFLSTSQSNCNLFEIVWLLDEVLGLGCLYSSWIHFPVYRLSCHTVFVVKYKQIRAHNPLFIISELFVTVCLENENMWARVNVHIWFWFRVIHRAYKCVAFLINCVPDVSRILEISWSWPEVRWTILSGLKSGLCQLFCFYHVWCIVTKRAPVTAKTYPV